jgi:hypothetical protein
MLAPGATCKASYCFLPQSAGSKSATLIVSAPQASVSATMTGSAYEKQSLQISPSSHAFGDVIIHAQTAPTTFVLTNTGTTASYPLSTTIDAWLYTITSNSCTGILAAGTSCSIDVAGTPYPGSLYPGGQDPYPSGLRIQVSPAETLYVSLSENPVFTCSGNYYGSGGWYIDFQTSGWSSNGTCVIGNTTYSYSTPCTYYGGSNISISTASATFSASFSADCSTLHGSGGAPWMRRP